jgi:hypothetical protein
LVTDGKSPPPPSGIASREVWAAARSLGLYGKRDAELETLLLQHRSGPASADRVIAASARHVVDLRRGMAAGGSC